MVWPNGSNTIPRVSSEFSLSRRNPVTGNIQPHWGIDLVGFDVVRSPVAGTIIYAGYNGGYGNQVQIRTDSGFVASVAHNRAFIRKSGRVYEGEPVAYMGTTGQSTGVHSHYETRPGGGTAINPRDYHATNAGAAGVGGEDDMTPEQDRRLAALYQAIFGAVNVPPTENPTGKITWAKPYGEKNGEAFYGLLDIVIYSQQLVAQNAGVLAALQTAVSQLSAGSGVALDMKAIEDAAERGAKDALSGLVLTADIAS